MSNSYQLVVLDWEGTISDTLGPILNTVNAAAQSLGFGELDFNQARQYVDLGLEGALKKLFPLLLESQQEQLVQVVQNDLEFKAPAVCLIPGAREFMESLQQAKIDIAVATNKGQNSLIQAIEEAGLDKLIQATRSAGQVLPKPHPQMLQELMQVFGVEPKTTVMIGDSVTDMQMARSIKVAAIGVDFYHQQSEALKAAGAMEVFDDYQLLARFLDLPNR